MSKTLQRFGPIALSFAVALACCWPYLEGSDSGFLVLEQSALPQIERRLIQPEVGKVIDRDLFIQNVELVDELSLLDDLELEIPNEPLQAALNPTEILSDFRLEATCLSGRRRFAMINSELVEQGDDVSVDDQLTVEVSYIADDYVLLRIDENHLKLTYPDPSSAATPAPRTKARRPRERPPLIPSEPEEEFSKQETMIDMVKELMHRFEQSSTMMDDLWRHGRQ